MSILDIATLSEIISTPADSCTLDEIAVPVGGFHDAYDVFTPEFIRRKFRWSWGKVTQPQERISVLISTIYELLPEEDGTLTVHYNSMASTITVGGAPFRDRYVGPGLYPVNYDPDKHELVRYLALALQPLSNPVASAPSVTGG